MKKILLGTVALAALGMAAAPASAADLAARPYTKAPPPMVQPIYDWSGFYIGINGGGGTSHKCWDLMTGTLATAEGCHDATGGTVGGQIGYRWQLSSWVFGLEGQGNWADFKGSNTNLTNTLLRDTSKIDAFGLITGQVGYAWNSALFYVKGGGAVVGDKQQHDGHCEQCAERQRQANPLGWHGRRRSRIWLRAELVGWRRIRPHVPGQEERQLHDARRRVQHDGKHPPGRRYGPRSPELPLRRPDHREVLILAPTRENFERPASRRPFFICVPRPSESPLAAACCRHRVTGLA